MSSGVAAQTFSGSAADTTQERAKLLLVDDDRDNLLALQAVLEPLGQELMLASSGLEALRLCLEHDFAAMLLDVRMPEMDGFETAELIRARKRSSHTPILFLTGYRSDEQLFRGYDLGAVDFLFKPIVPEILQSKVAVFVELSRKEQSLRRQTAALARTEQKFRAVLEAAPDAMVITDGNGVIQLANSRTDSLFGYEREQLLGARISSLIPAWSSIAATGSFGVNSFSELRLTGSRRNGTTFPVQITISPFEAEGQFITTAIRDATEQVLAEQRMLRINAELEKRVAERTVGLMRSNDALRQFAWAASHDLQEPTRMVLAYSQWLKRSATGKLSDKERDMLVCVEENGRRLQALLGALREYIYISETGDEPWTTVDCNAIVETALANLEGVAAESKAIITCDHLPSIQSIKVLLVQLFQNLIGNAIKYKAEERTPEIAITSYVGADGAQVFAVRDNGIGIEPQHREYVFDVFKRLHGHRYSGTGIGLAICKAAVERLGGKIWVESVPGHGSTFYFSLSESKVA
ncbi:MAG: response regulator [Acidobacteriaceae bacterium]|nr:response regulator [Acidobacteriaceae bacterium]